MTDQDTLTDNNSTTSSQPLITPEVVIPQEDFSPLLSNPVKERSYTNHQVDPTAPAKELEEPTFARPNFEELDEEIQNQERTANPVFNQLDKKEKTMGAEMMADMTLDIYEKGCFYLGKVPEISEGKIDRLIAEGDLDPHLTIDTESGKMPMKMFAGEYNDSIREAFEVSDEFKEKVRAPLIRVLTKRGIGMTDEQTLAYYFVTDFGAKAAQAFMLRRTANQVIDSLKETTQAMRENKARQTPPAPTPQPTPPPYTPPAPTASADTTYAPASDYSSDISKVAQKTATATTTASAAKVATPLTNLEEQVIYFGEPEEGVFANLKDREGFTEEYVSAPNMPKFGDPDILQEMERLSKEDDMPRRRATVKRTPRKNKK